ncbi:hypothetical protein ASPCAL07718 [Aspergillus calidoustus]|uniref:BZIP domain-containing protein n=1 Tax=Aspergillus calidoustus TaxID=454130 RepID=A0A0U5GRH4_ASPCI|nr:hypothetical protein ASPCAL07718 [Aspergillus calidoustus]
MEYQHHLTLRSPTGTPGSSAFIGEVGYPSLPLDLICGLNNYVAFQAHNQGTGMLPTTPTISSSESSPIVSPAPSASPSTADPSESKAARRRAQNRDAQRRFRERKEHQKKILEKDADALRTDYQALLRQYADTATDMTRLVKENDALRLEVKNLRYQWRLVLAVLQRLQGAESIAAALPEDAFVLEDVAVQAYPEDFSSGPLPNMTRFLS